MKKQKALLDIYKRLYRHFGPRNWWPAKTPFEVMVGAILTQNAAWSNVEKAITNLKKKKLLSFKKMKSVDCMTLRLCVKPSGFYKEKAKKLKDFVMFLDKRCKGGVTKLSREKTRNLRQSLLNVRGVGPETADSILLYALKRKTFVVDAYTRRIFSRHDLVKEGDTYNQIKTFFEENLPRDRQLYNEYHALIVEAGKNYCKKKKPLCSICPLGVVKPKKNMI